MFSGKEAVRFSFGKTQLICFCFFLLLLSACTPAQNGHQNALERNLKLAGNNRPELEKVIRHYSGNTADSLKLKAVQIMIANLENEYHYGGKWLERFDVLFFPRIGKYSNVQTDSLRKSLDSLIGPLKKENLVLKKELTHLSSEYLIKNTDEAFESWQTAPWKNWVSFDAFCNYILPYKCFNEYPEDWRNTLRTRYKKLLNDPSVNHSMPEVTCGLVNEQLTWFNFSRVLGDYPAALSIGQILLGQKGDCIEMAALGAYTARAQGIPVAIDYTPQYGNINDTHKWNALILSDAESLSFEGGETEPGEMTYLREGDNKFAKVFRKRMSWVESSFAAKAREYGIRHIPDFLSDPRIQDVTAAYTKVGDIRLRVKGRNGTAVYLCVFKLREWVALAGGILKNNEVEFSQMGRGLVYMPMFYNNHRYEAAGSPVLLPAEGPQKLIDVNPTAPQNLVLYRKFPFKRRWKQFLQGTLTGARFEAGSDSMFTKPLVLHEIPEARAVYLPKIQNDLSLKDRASYDSIWAQAYPSIRDSFRYVRIVFDKELTFRLGEMEFYSTGERRALAGRPIGNIPDPGLAFDGFPGRTIKLTSDSTKAHWAGLDLGKKTLIEKIRFIPATDANAIREGATYELYYWKGKWVSAGIQKATGFSLEYKEVPGNGLYWLNCRECNSKEERIFTYEDGKQVWW